MKERFWNCSESCLFVATIARYKNVVSDRNETGARKYPWLYLKADIYSPENAGLYREQPYSCHRTTGSGRKSHPTNVRNNVY